MPEHIVHIAGLDVKVGSQLRQRCAWCGAIIEDVDLSRTAGTVEEDGSATEYPTWTVGALVAMTDGGSASWLVEHEDGDQLPAECCAQLDHEVTT